MKILFLVLFFSLTVAHADPFTPSTSETTQFKYWADRANSMNDGREYHSCHYESRMNKDGTGIELKIGVPGTNNDFFGTDLIISENEYPLKEGFYKEFIVIGSSSMYLKYNHGLLEFKFLKDRGLWSQIYPFTLEVDPFLAHPKKFSGKMQGYERNILGQPKTHVTVDCEF